MLYDRASATTADRAETAEPSTAPTALQPAGFPLTLAREGDRLIVGAMHGGRGFRRQLIDMGVRPGGRICVLRAGRRGPLLVLAGETRVGIGRGMAEKIEVVPAGSDADE